MMTDIKNLSAINADPGLNGSLVRSQSSLKIRQRDRSANNSKTATFDLNNISKIIPVSAASMASNKHHSSSSALQQSTTSLQKALKNETRAPPFIPAGKTVKKHSYVDNSSLYNYDNEKATLYSTWTPLSDEKANQKVSGACQKRTLE